MIVDVYCVTVSATRDNLAIIIMVGCRCCGCGWLFLRLSQASIGRYEIMMRQGGRDFSADEEGHNKEGAA